MEFGNYSLFAYKMKKEVYYVKTITIRFNVDCAGFDAALFLLVLLVACGGSSTSGTSSTPTPVPTAAPTLAPSPTSPTAATGAMTAFQGNSFTISYPQNWQTTTKANNIFTFADSTGNIKMTITVAPDPNGTISADSVASTALQAAQVLLKNATNSFRFHLQPVLAAIPGARYLYLERND